MAKELPYFQFEPAQYLTGNIQFCSLEAQGLFINICAIYWQRECDLFLNQVLKKFDKNDLVNELIDNDVIKTDFDKIRIEFLDEQFDIITKSKSRLSQAGKKGALIKKQATLKPPLSDVEATLKQLDKIREYKIIEDNINNIDYFFKDLENGNELIEICRINKFDVIRVKLKLIDFRKNAELSYPNYGKFVSHFKNWLLKNPPINPDAPLKMVY